MSVGTASIKRAAGKAEQKERKQTASAKEQTTAKKVTSAAIPAVSPEVAEQMKITANQVCHLTEELPIHLL